MQKVSKHSDFSLVFNKNLMEILPYNGLGLRPDEVGQKCLKLLHLWHYSQNIQKSPNFFSLQTWRLAESFEGLNSSLAQSTEELCYC